MSLFDDMCIAGVADQAVIVELRNQIHLLKNQHHDQLEQLNRERKCI